MDLRKSRINALAAVLRTAPGQVVPFVGAGCSIPFGGATWGGMLAAMADAALSDHRMSEAARQEVGTMVADGAYFRAGDRIIESFGGLGSPAFEALLRDLTRVSREPEDSILHRLPLLGSDLILTTNYDSAIQHVWNRARTLPRLRIKQRLDRHVLKQRGKDEPCLLHLHGTVEDPESVVLGQSQYDSVLASTGFVETFKTLARARTLLFLGYGVDDFDLRLVMELSKLELAGAGSNHYAILPTTMADRVHELDRWGVLPIWYENDGTHSGALDALRDILEAALPGFAAVRYRQAKGKGVVAWVSKDKSSMIMVDSDGNVRPAPTSDAFIDLADPATLSGALQRLRTSIHADDIWMHREGGVWRIYVDIGDTEVVIGDHPRKELAVSFALSTVPHLPRKHMPNGNTDKAEYRREQLPNGSLISVRVLERETWYHWYLPREAGTPFPLGPTSPEVAKSYVERLETARQYIEELEKGGVTPSEGA